MLNFENLNKVKKEKTTKKGANKGNGQKKEIQNVTFKAVSNELELYRMDEIIKSGNWEIWFLEKERGNLTQVVLKNTNKIKIYRESLNVKKDDKTEYKQVKKIIDANEYFFLTFKELSKHADEKVSVIYGEYNGHTLYENLELSSIVEKLQSI